MTTHSYLCIGCPLGCQLEVDEATDGHLVEVRGFSCKRGAEYARQEHTAPQRTATTTVQIVGARYPRLPVRTVAPVPKLLVAEICRALRTVTVEAPIALGELVLPNVLGLGVDVVASRTMVAR
ncbi:MAG: DUF1667 domain-containing protein [Caldilineaceae bacterium]